MKSTPYLDTTIHYSTYGEGSKTLVLLHGFLENKEMWNFLLPHIEGYRTISIDLLGHGKTNAISQNHTMDLMANSVLKVMDVEKVNEATFVGHSMGGYVALALADLYDEDHLIEKLCLFHSTSRNDNPEKRKDRERVIKVIEQNKEIFIQQAIPNLFAQNHLIDLKSVISKTVKTALETPTDGIVKSTRGMMERKAFDENLNDFSFDIHFIIGDKDPIISFESYIDQLKFENVTYSILENIGHMSHLEDEAMAVENLLEFLNL